MSACIEQLLGSNDGTAVFIHWDADSAPTLLMESVFILECLAPSELNADRFLPPTPIRVVMNHHGKPELNTDGRFISLPKTISNGPAHLIPEFEQIKKLIPPMVEASEQLMSEQVTKLKQQTVATMNQKLSVEINRLETLAKINVNIRLGEISKLKEEQKKLGEYLGQARSRLDSIRLIWKGSMERLQN
jgi:ATP-dependent helicase HepA